MDYNLKKDFSRRVIELGNLLRHVHPDKFNDENTPV